MSGQEPTGAAVIEARGLTKRFGDRAALRDVSFSARPGELLAVIGPNGAGKTTLLSILAGIREPGLRDDRACPGEIGWVPQGAALYSRLTVDENLRLFARLEGIDRRRAPRSSGCSIRPGSASGAATRWGRSRAATSSGSTSRSACSASPAVLLLDEPSTGLDPRQRERLWEFVLGLAGTGTTVIYSTHHLQEAERYGDRLLVLADGERVFDGTAAELHAAAPDGAGGDFEAAFVRFLRERGH